MLAFRYLIGVSVGAIIALSHGGEATSQQLLSLRKFQSTPGVSHSREKVAQSRSSANSQPAFGLTQIPTLKTPQPASGSQETSAQQNSQPASSPQETSAPQNITPSSNPLMFPTEPSEVNVEQVQPITLEQAVGIARRNNPSLQEALLTLERTREALREALAARYPNLSTQLNLSRSYEDSGGVGGIGGVGNVGGDTGLQQGLPNQQTTGDQQTSNTNNDTAISAVDNQQSSDNNNDTAISQETTEDQQTTEDEQIFNQPISNEEEDAASDFLTTTLQLSYNLYTGGRRDAQIEAAEQQVRFNLLQVEQVVEQLRLDVANAYYDVQQAQSQVQINQASVEAAQQSVRDAQSQLEAGLGTRFDVLQARVQLANNRQQLRRSRSQLRIVRRQFTQQLGLGQQAEVTAMGSPEVAGSWDLSLQESIIQAYQNRAELRQQLARININQQQRRIALAATRPQVNLFASYEIQDTLDDDFNPSDNLALGAGLQWLLYDGGAAEAAAEQQETNIAIARTNFDRLRNQIRTDVEQGYYNLQASQQNIKTAQLAVRQAEESLRLARLRFRAGVGTQIEVTNAQSDLTQARGNFLTAIIDYNRSLAQLERAVSNQPDNRLFDRP
ncbi:MAG: transporter [Cyanobacteria bacterium SW_12_48_29]|nr:MAG: transporter [Cyanobacteria bacterium QH_10_48_56]PSO86777.1 MAG: transporter [Cyanobacteria bacterium QS_5_48_63]PSP01076.1 MAG: transporter [Cyanobacteria bacterium SW_12_48_29]PSP16253.1 MAG: transporter [Cyanobacteria bacterium SW_5_48_44]